MKKERIKYFHLSPDDKFFDYIIENCETIAPGENAYIIRNSKSNELQYVKSEKVIITKSLDSLLRHFDEYKYIEKVFIHFLTGDAVPFTLQIPQNIKIYWIFWGADGYNLPKLKTMVYKEKTYKILCDLDVIKSETLIKKFKKNILLHLGYGRSAELMQAVRRVNFCATWVNGDYNLVKMYNPGMRFIYFNNNSIEQIIGETNKGTSLEPPLSISSKEYIILGNSGFPTNNHLEALEVLKEHSKYDVVVPLSYGDKKYIEYIKEAGTASLGSRFIPVVDFLPKEVYNGIIQNAKFIIMNHRRQQAANNILTALWYGKVVYMDTNSTLYQTFKQWNLSVYDIDLMLFEEEISVSLEKNRKILSKYMGDKVIKDSFIRLLKD